MSGQKKSGVSPWVYVLIVVLVLLGLWWFFGRDNASSATAQPVAEATPIVETAAPATPVPSA